MVETSERVTVRIPQDLIEALKTIQQNLGHPTISDTIRSALESYVQVKLSPSNIRKVIVDLSKQDTRQLEELVQEGSSVSVDDAIRAAVREYVRARLDHLRPTAGHAASHHHSSPAGEALAHEGGSPPS
jgi:Arc/MetJ-type ribon-helix-helix transcriptional regulator